MAINKYFDNLITLAKRVAAAALLGSTTALLVSCGGGGADNGGPTQNGALAVLPETGSLYANVPFTINVAGGRAPYLVTSNEQTLVPLTSLTISGNSFTIVPNQPGVVDIGQDPNQVPSRRVIITVRDSAGTQASGTYDVLQNFLTGYGLSISTTAGCSGGGAPGSGPEACAGADSLISLVPVTNGIRYANKQMRFTALFGAFAFILDSTGITGPTVTSVADTAGNVTARIRVTAGAATQYAQFRLTDVATGAYRDITFIITNSTGGQTALSVLPSSISLQGATTASCGTGLANVFVFGGLPPYRASTTNPGSIMITPPEVSRSGDAFSVQIFNPSVCLSPGNVVITDAAGAFISIDVTTTPGSTPPVTALAVAPSAFCLRDGDTAVVSVTGGNNTKVINSSNTLLASAIPTTGSANFTTTINALGAGGAAGTPVVLTVSDGANTATINVLRKTVCP